MGTILITCSIISYSSVREKLEHLKYVNMLGNLFYQSCQTYCVKYLINPVFVNLFDQSCQTYLLIYFTNYVKHTWLFIWPILSVKFGNLFDQSTSPVRYTWQFIWPVLSGICGNLLTFMLTKFLLLVLMWTYWPHYTYHGGTFRYT